MTTIPVERELLSHVEELLACPQMFVRQNYIDAAAKLRALLSEQPQAGAGQDVPYPAGVEEALERTDWTPEEALRWYAEGRNFDTVNGRTRIIDTGAIASNALKHASIKYLELKGDAELTELREIAAQSALAGMREAFESVYAGRANFERNPGHPTFYAHEPCLSRWDAFQAGAAWQRTQPQARHDQGDEVRRLREALEQIVACDWTSSETATDFALSQTKGHLISKIKRIARAALTHSPKGEEE